MGENVLLLQALAAGLPGNSGALLSCLDFRKAYDTVDRAFLGKLMRAMGVPEAFMSWVELLLGDTRARCCVNGFVSRHEAYEAGVRQGCPLAPLLYLFVAQGLLCLLKARLPGVKLGGREGGGCLWRHNTPTMPKWGSPPGRRCPPSCRPWVFFVARAGRL